MRLIDADKLFEWLEDSWADKYPTGDGKQYHTLMIYEIKDEIDDAETVEAIPTEYIIELAKEALCEKEDFRPSSILFALVETWRAEK